MSSNPEAEYSRRLEQRRAAVTASELLHRKIGNARLILLLSACVVAWLSFASEILNPWWLTVPSSVFLALAIWHGRVIRNIGRHRRSVRFYENGFARLEERWEGLGEPGDRFSDPSHPYARDLDLFGKGSLFELLSTARTRIGEETLASWLKNPANAATIQSRQEAVEELRNNLDLREELALLGEDVRAGLDSESFSVWGMRTPAQYSVKLRTVIFLAAVYAVVSLAVWGCTGQHIWFLSAVLIELLLVYMTRSKIRPAAKEAEKACLDLKILSLILSRLEQEAFTSLHLRKLRAANDRNGQPPSRIIARLNRLTELLESGRNPLFAPAAFLLMWEAQFVFLITAWHRKYGRAIDGWLAGIGEFESLSSLAGYAFEHPADPFPELTGETPYFEGRQLGHPLIPQSTCVRNDLKLDTHMRLLVVSGSNMSGKSTLLRTIGINTVLALSGAPVRAHYLRLSPLQPGASIRIIDSLKEGTSRFYAEITRLRQLVSLSRGPVPLLFLLDELLHGTNSYDRRIGAEAVAKALVKRDAIGLLTTHDLSLAHIADLLAPRCENVHFEDHIKNGKMVFDYRLHPGVVTNSNALELMRSVGLEV